MTKKKKKTMTTKKSTPHAMKRSTKKPAPAAALPMTALEQRVRVALTAQLGAPVPVEAPEPAAPVLVVDEHMLVAPVLAVDEALVTAERTDCRVRSEAARLGSKAVMYLRRHARHPYGPRGCAGIVTIAREAWRAALVELETAS